MKTLLCIDGNSIMNRSFYGIRNLTTADGFPTGALYGFTRVILREVERLKPDYAVVAFDRREPTFRHEMYAEYKAGRHATPPELSAQMPIAHAFAGALGLHAVSVPGFEADDILGTLSQMGNDAGDCMSYLLTGDRDALQLIGDNVHVLLATNKETVDTDKEVFFEKYGIYPDRYVDVKALMGDASDHIPGVAGIGEKTAFSLIAEFASLENLYNHLDAPSIKAGVRKKLEDGRESALFSRKLAEICRCVPLDTLESYRYAPDRDALIDLLIKYQFSDLLAKIKAGAGSDGTQKREESTPTATDTTPAVQSQETPDATCGTDFDVAIAVYADEFLTVCDGRVTSLPKDDPGTADALRALLSEPAKKVLCHDAKTLYHALDALGIRYRNATFDTMLAAYVVNPGLSDYSLQNLLTVFCEYMSNGHGDEACRLAELAKNLADRLDATGQTDVFERIEMPLASVLCDMEARGFSVDTGAIAAFGNSLDQLISDCENTVYTLAGEKFNINSPKQLGIILFDKLLLPTSKAKKTKTGYSTDAEVLAKLRPYHPIIDAILSYRQYAKLKSTYVEGLLREVDEVGFIHTTFKQTGTVTGRLSSTEPNLQNIPIKTPLGRQMRRFFIASSPDRVLIDADYSQIELRILADVAGDTAMQSAFINGFDIHTDTASRVFGVSPDEVTVEQRKRAKAINFGIMYGMGEYSLSEDLGISIGEAKAYISGYLSTYPQIEAYLDGIVKQAERNGYVSSKLGRRRPVPEIHDANRMRKKFGERVAMNSPIQGTAADIIKLAMVKVCARLERENLDAHLILQVHDELILDASRDCAEAALNVLKQEMENTVRLSVPLTVEASIGDTWYDTH